MRYKLECGKNGNQNRADDEQEQKGLICAHTPTVILLPDTMMRLQLKQAHERTRGNAGPCLARMPAVYQSMPTMQQQRNEQQSATNGGATLS